MNTKQNSEDGSIGTSSATCPGKGLAQLACLLHTRVQEERGRGGGGQSLPSPGPALELAGDAVPLLQVVFFKRQ